MAVHKIVEYTAPNGEKKLGVVINSLGVVGNMTQNLCYGDNTLFIIESYTNHYIDEEGGVTSDYILSFGGIIVQNAILPDYDKALEKVIATLK